MSVHEKLNEEKGRRIELCLLTQASSCHRSGDQQFHPALGEVVEGLLALPLHTVPMDGGGHQVQTSL